VVDDDRDEITFNPATPAGATYALLGTPAQTALTGIACPSSSRCTVVDGVGDAVSFNPTAPGHQPVRSVLAAGAVAVDCPATGTCVAVDAAGERATFAPLDPAAVTTARIDLAQPSALACLTSTYCLVIDGAGQSAEFDPHGNAVLATRTVGSAGTITGVACPVAQECVTVDSSGHAIVGTTTLPDAPTAAGAPALSGRARLGDSLSASAGRWSVAPTSELRQWLRCSTHGTRCTAIAGATDGRLRLATADVGHTVRLRAQAADQAGFGATQTSPPSLVVVAVPSAPSVSSARLTGRGRPGSRLRLMVTAARYGPQLQTLILTPPAGLRYALRTRRARHGAAARPVGLTVTAQGRRVAFSARRSGRGLRIVLTREAHTVAIVIGPSGLSASAALRRRLAGRRPGAIELRVTLLLRGRPLRTAVALALR
jgi:hypothetical protein